MAKTKKYDSFVLEQKEYIKNYECRLNHKYERVSASRFVYTGFDEYGIPNNYGEHLLYDGGAFVITNFEGAIAILMVSGFKLDIYGYPIQYICYTKNGIGNIVRDNTNAVCVYDNDYRESIRTGIAPYINDLVNSKLAERLNVNAMKIQLAIKGSSADRLFMENMAMQHALGIPYVFLCSDDGKTPFTSPIEISNVNPQSYLAELRDYRNNIHNDILEHLGINFAPIDKKERVNTSDSNSNNMLVNQVLYDAWNIRATALEKANKMFGTNFSVAIAKDFYNMLDDISEGDTEGEFEGGGEDV